MTDTNQSEGRMTDLSADASARGEAGAVWDQVFGVEGLYREVTQPRTGALLLSAAEKNMREILQTRL